jgi:hypothetical protein
MTITEPGIYNIPEADYHADPCPEPSLSSSIAIVLAERTAAHARQEHPRLNPAPEREESPQMDFGTAAHALLTGQATDFVIIDPEQHPNKDGKIPDGWTNAAMKAARDAAYEAGKVPLLPSAWGQVRSMAKSARRQLDRTEDLQGLFTPEWGVYEQTLIWREKNGVWCRCRPDGLSHGRGVMVDYKTDSASAAPDAWARKARTMRYDIQDSFYRRGVRALFGKNPAFLFAVQEKEAPFALAVHAMTPEKQAAADYAVDRAIQLWCWCLKNNAWPGYDRRTHYHDLKPWERVELETAQIRDESQPTAEQFARMITWQAPQQEEAAQ